MIGRLLRPLRSGPDKLAGNDPRIAAPTTIAVASDEFASGTTMPSAYRGGAAVFPPIRWSNVPSDARELVLVVEDVDVPFPAPLVHAIAYGFDPEQTSLPAGGLPRMRRGGASHIAGAWLGKAAGIGPGYLAPTPIPGHGPHRYVFQIFALKRRLPRFERPPSREALIAAMAGCTIARGALVGLAEA